VRIGIETDRDARNKLCWGPEWGNRTS